VKRLVLGWIYLGFHTFGYFNQGAEIMYNGDYEKLEDTLNYWPENQPLPIILYRKFTSSFQSPPFKYGLVKRDRAISDGGCCVMLVFVETKLTRDLLNQQLLLGPRYHLWLIEDQDNIGEILEKAGLLTKLKGHMGVTIQALRLSDKLTRWLRGDVGWTAGPKPNMALHDFATGFEPKWKRKPLTPEMLVKP
jgi:hypothetical protein